MTDIIDWNRVQPLRVSRGAHQEGSGEGCAMEIISYITGETKITDYPKCSARPLARIVQAANDTLAYPNRFLSPEDAVAVVDLGMLTVGTARVDNSVTYSWIAEVLDNSEWGVIRYSGRPDIIALAADVNRQAAAGNYDARQAYDLSTIIKSNWIKSYDMYAAETAVSIGFSLDERAMGTGANWMILNRLNNRPKEELLGRTRAAIMFWRDLMGLGAPAEVDVQALESVMIK